MTDKRLRHAVAALVFCALSLFGSGGSTAAATATPSFSAAALNGLSIGSIAANRRRRLAAAATYDTSVGQSVDSNGFAALPLRVGAHKYFVRSTGSDAVSCATAENPATPKATVAGGLSCVTDNAHNGDQVLLAEGSTFAENMPWLAYKGGFSATYPTVISSYDPADPTNDAKYGRGDQRNARPAMTVTDGGVGGSPFSYLAIKGIVFQADPNVSSPAALDFRGNNITGGGNYVLIENCIFAYTGFSFTDGGDGTTPPLSQHLILRNSAFYGVWASSTAHVGNVYVEGVDALTFEDDVDYHSGWRIGGGVTRNTVNSSGGPDVFRHPLYIQANAGTVIVRRNLFADGAADAGIARGANVTWQQNVSLRSPAGTGLGAGNSVDFGAQANGSLIDASYNLSVDGIDLNSTNLSGYAYTLANAAPGSRVHHNLLIYSTASSGNNDVTVATTGGAAFGVASRHTYTEFEFNTGFHWSASGNVTRETSTPIHSSYTDNIWDNPASGSNSNSGSASFPNAYTESALYAALTPTFATITDYNSLTAYTIAHPEAHVQRKLLSLAFAGYGMATSPTDTTAPTLSSPTGSSPSAGNATIGVTTNDGTGRLYYELLTTSTPPNVSQVKFGLDATGTVGTKPGVLAIASPGAKSVSLSSVPAGTYYAHFTHEDAAGNKSPDAVSASFAVAAAGWDPSTLGASLFGWWTADQPSTVNTGSSNVWSAYAGSAGPLTQATAGNRPTYTSGVKLSFDSTDELDAASAPTSYDAVAVITTNSSNATWRTLFWSTAGHHPILLESGTDRMGAFDDAGFNASGSTIAASTTAIVHVRMDSSGHVFQSLNGGTLSAQIADYSAVGAGGRAVNVIGSNQGGGQPIGDIKAIVISSSVLTSTDLNKTVGSLACEWGLQGLLPSGHPYKSTCP